MANAKKVAIVTGSNKGIGLAIVKALLADPSLKDGAGIVYLTARDPDRGEEALQQLAKEGLKAHFHKLDIDSLESIQAFREFLKKEHGGIDILVNNAAIAFNNQTDESFGYQAQETNRVNYFGTVNVCHQLFPLLRKGARVVHVSSCEGHLSKINGTSPNNLDLQAQFSSPDLTEEKLATLINTFIKLAQNGGHHEAGWPNSTYVVSKVGISALTRIQQKELGRTRPGDGILVNCCHPGYVDTDMTSHNGPLTVEQGAVAPTYLALLPPGSDLAGAYIWHDKRVVDWVNDPLPAPGY